MFSYFKNFLKHSSIYGIGNAIHRSAAFLLIPLYTRVLSPSEYGALEMFYVTASVMGTLLGMNIAHGTLRFFFEYEEEIDRKRVISTSLISSLLISTVAVTFLNWHVGFFSLVIFKSTEYASLFRIIFVIVVLQLSREITFAYLRAKEQSLLYISIATVQLLSQVGFNLYAVVVLNLGIAGILIGNMVSIFLTWLVLFVIALRYCGLHFHVPTLKSLGHYCLPFVLSGIAGIIINNADRIMLNNYQTLAVVGVYALALRFGIGLRDLIIEPFTLNFGQSRFAIMKQENAREIYARIMTYFVFVILFLSLGIALFAKEFLMVIAAPEFTQAYKVVPVVLSSVVFVGMTYIFQTGLLIEKRTKYIFYITTLSALLIIVFNRLFIPRLSLYGAALAVLSASLIACAATYFLSQRFYVIRYEFARIAKIFAVGISLYLVSYVSLRLFAMSGVAELVMKAALFLSFPLWLSLVSFYRREERDNLKRLKEKFLRKVARQPGAVSGGSQVLP